MIKVRKYNLLILMFLVCLISVFAVSYNVSVRNMLSSVSEDNKQLLKSGNEQIVAELKNTDSIKSWDEILNKYADFDVVVENADNDVVAKNSTDVSFAESITLEKLFNYKGETYTVISSVHFLNNFSEHSGSLVNFIITELLIGVTVLLILITLLYLFMLRPYKTFYDSIEEYEKTGKIEKKNFRGYVGKVYNRFFELTTNLEQHQDNQKRIIASISHDIKTPLTSIMGYTERLSKDNISEERKERYLDTIYTKAVEIRQLVDEFDEYLGYNNSGQMDRERLKLSDLCEALKNEYEEELLSYGINTEFICEIKDEAILVDKKKFSRVFGNIIGNSVKHLKDKEYKIIKFTIIAYKKEVIIKIADNGQGVKEENLEVIFEPFYTSDKGRKVAGLGLAICHEIIESHNGQIYAEASDLGGLEIIIKLPLLSEFD